MPLLRSRRHLAAAAGAITLVGVLAGCGSHDDAPASLTQGVGTTLDRALPARIAAIPLKEPDGHTVTLGSFRGRTVVVSDSMTLCTEDCPLDTANVVTAAQATNDAGLGQKVVFLTITVDPQRDTPRRLTAYRKLYDPDGRLPNWRLLTGSPADITALWKYLGVYWEKVAEDKPPDHDWLTGKPLTYDVAHADEVLLFDSSQHERMVISGHADVPQHAAVPKRMRSYLSSLGQRHLNRPGPDTWTPTDVEQAVSWLTGTKVGSS